MTDTPTPAGIQPLWEEKRGSGCIKPDRPSLSEVQLRRERSMQCVFKIISDAADSGAITPKISDITRLTGIAKGTVGRYIRDLILSGKIVRNGKSHTSCYFDITKTGKSTILRTPENVHLLAPLPSDDAEKTTLIKSNEREINAQILQIITDCARENKPVPRQNAIAKSLSVEHSRVRRSLYALVRDGSLIKNCEYGTPVFTVVSIGLMTAPPAPSPKPSDDYREPSAPPRLKWLDIADARLEILKREDEAIAKRMKRLRDEMGLDVEPEAVL